MKKLRTLEYHFDTLTSARINRSGATTFLHRKRGAGLKFDMQSTWFPAEFVEGDLPIRVFRVLEYDFDDKESFLKHRNETEDSYVVTGKMLMKSCWVSDDGGGL
jgi:hypothetical protein